MPIGVELRAEQLKDNVSWVLKLLKEYEDALLYEDVPRRKAKYRKDIEELSAI